jgi:hypothetical protein
MGFKIWSKRRHSARSRQGDSRYGLVYHSNNNVIGRRMDINSRLHQKIIPCGFGT